MNKFSDMSTFVAVVESGSFSEAARRLGTAKSIVSQRVHQLEKRLGCTLLKRGRPLQLTDAGRSFFGQSRLLLQELERIEEEAQEAGASLHGTLRLAVPTTFMTRQLAPLLARFAAKYPALCVDVEAEDRLSNLQDGHFDIEIRPRREFERQAIADRPTKRTQRGEAVTAVIHRMPFVQIREIDREVIIQDVAEADFVGAPMHVATLGRASVVRHCIDVDLSFK
nr:LysR family transcriptional regulator [Burkholderia ubonensis]